MRVNIQSNLRTDLPAAFRLVQQLLAEKPRAFQDLIKDGLALHQTQRTQVKEVTPDPITQSRVETNSIVAETSSSGTARRKAREQSESKAARDQEQARKLNLLPEGKRRMAMAQKVLPEGHPWVSAKCVGSILPSSSRSELIRYSFLKRRVLPVLASQSLIIKKATRTGIALPGQRIKGHLSFAWHLTQPKDGPWNRTEHWNRLLSGELPGKPAEEYQTFLASRDKATRDKRFASGRDQRTEREIWQWQRRPSEISTRLQRMHLSTRRQNARDGKERRLIFLRKRLDKQRNEVEKEVQEILGRERKRVEAGGRGDGGGNGSSGTVVGS